MAINPQDMVKFAFDLYKENNSTSENTANNEPKEIEFRTVVNRAYYGAFLTARDFAKVSNESGSVHSDVIKHFEKKKAGIVSNNLDSLKKLRTKADYKPKETLSEQEAKTSCRTANKIVREIEKLSKK
ncbi:HEPN domain-containing protein [Sessilibacter corallicola]|uniref:HEPN domain-containing protein n=1 Tax=Sessilibacter corallicola TaxID=2904075 RepID=A0ABQ0A871_9GAMM